MLTNLVHNLSPFHDGFLFSYLILAVLILGIWASATDRAFMVNRLGKLGLGLGLTGTIYSLIKAFTALGNPNVDPALKGELLAKSLGESIAFVALGLTVFAILYVWDMFKHTEGTEDVPATQE